MCPGTCGSAHRIPEPGWVRTRLSAQFRTGSRRAYRARTRCRPRYAGRRRRRRRTRYTRQGRRRLVQRARGADQRVRVGVVAAGECAGRVEPEFVQRSLGELRFVGLVTFVVAVVVGAGLVCDHELAVDLHELLDAVRIVDLVVVVDAGPIGLAQIDAVAASIVRWVVEVVVTVPVPVLTNELAVEPVRLREHIFARADEHALHVIGRLDRRRVVAVTVLCRDGRTVLADLQLVAPTRILGVIPADEELAVGIADLAAGRRVHNAFGMNRLSVAGIIELVLRVDIYLRAAFALVPGRCHPDILAVEGETL